MTEKAKEDISQNARLMAVLELLRSGYWYDRKVRDVLKPFDISHEQFNVLRILEHNQSRSFSLKEIQSRLMNKTDNTTRLVEKLKQKGYVKSNYSKSNRRMLQIRITPSGILLLTKIQKPLSVLHEKVDSVLSNEDAEELVRILRGLRTMK